MKLPLMYYPTRSNTKGLHCCLYALQVGPQRAGIDTTLGPDHLGAAALGLRSVMWAAREPDVDSAPAGPTHGTPQVGRAVGGEDRQAMEVAELRDPE
jgi:hypothetical protein